MLFFFAPTAWGETPVPVGDEFQVNTYSPSFQRYPSVASEANGDFVVVWWSAGSDGSDEYRSIQGQRFSSSGDTVGDEFQVNTYTTDNQHHSSVASAANGAFVVVWSSFGSSGSDNYLRSIQGQRFSSSGDAVGDEFQVNSYTTGHQYDPSVASAADGAFVVVWTSNRAAGDDSGVSIQGQRYSSSGDLLGNQFQVNSYTDGSQRIPEIASRPSGAFVVVWTSYGSTGNDTSDASIQGQRYDASGDPLGGQFQVNTYTTDNQLRSSVSTDADGDFVVVWESSGSAGSDTSGPSIQGQRYRSSGDPRGGEFQVNAYTTDRQRWPVVALDADGDFVVVWYSSESAGSDDSLYSVQGRRFNSSGSPQGDQLQINSYIVGRQHWPWVASDAEGDFVVVWDSATPAGDDDSDDSIQAQRFALPLPDPEIFSDGFESGDTSAW